MTTQVRTDLSLELNVMERKEQGYSNQENTGDVHSSNTLPPVWLTLILFLSMFNTSFVK